jgi:hypothetical protein
MINKFVLDSLQTEFALAFKLKTLVKFLRWNVSCQWLICYVSERTDTK